jgi:predicted phosphodiesterase
MIRVAAVGDVHYSEDSKARLSADWSRLRECADVFLLAGDLTTQGRVEQARVLIEDLRAVQIPIIAILGNHDYHSDQNEAIRRELEGGGITVLEGENAILKINGETLGVAGTIGFGGGFIGACAHNFGEPEMKAFVRHTEFCPRNCAKICRS